MFNDGPVILAVVAIIIGCVLMFAAHKLKPGIKTSYTPANNLEKHLFACLNSTAVSQEMAIELMNATLLGLESRVDNVGPMKFSATFPAQFAREQGIHVSLNEDEFVFGPWVICFSSNRVLHELSRDPVLGGLVTQIGRVREFSARTVFQSARDQEIDVLLNPFFELSRSFTQDEIAKLLSVSD